MIFGRYKTEENKSLFDELYKHKDEIERAFGHPLSWERVDDIKLRRICVGKAG